MDITDFLDRVLGAGAQPHRMFDMRECPNARLWGTGGTITHYTCHDGDEPTPFTFKALTSS